MRLNAIALTLGSFLFFSCTNGFCFQADISPRVREAAALHSDISPPLRAIAPRTDATLPRLMRRPGRMPNRRPAGHSEPLSSSQGQAAPGEKRALAMAAASRSFLGMGLSFSGPQGRFSVDGDPPDTNGDIGPNHYVQIVNSSFAVFNRSGTVLFGPTLINTLWQGFGGSCETSTDGDPIVKYDKRADRWVISQFSVSAAPYLECIAVSKTADPLGAYYRYAFAFSDTNDYPKLGIWPDGYYFSFNMFDANNNSLGGEICALDRAAMLAGGTATKQCFGPNPDWYGMLPADLDGPLDPPLGSPNFVINLDPNSSSSLGLWKLHVDWATPAKSSFTGPTSITVASYTDLCANAADGSTCIPQLGTRTLLDGLGDRLMYRLAYRNMGSYETIVANHSIDPGGSGSGPGAIRWYEIRSPAGQPVLYQQGTFAPDSKTRWMGSMAMDGSGNIGLGYSVSSSSMYPAINFSGRLHSDPLNSLPQGETVLIASTGPHFDASGFGRWGDYTSLSVDPVDDCTFWYTNEYFTNSVRDAYQWQTRIGSFKFPTCAPATTLNVKAGWNLLGNGSSAKLNVASVFSDPSKINAVWKWVASKSVWAFYTPSQSDGGSAYAAGKGYDFLSSIDAGEGYWLNASSAFSLSLPAASSVASSSFTPALATAAGGSHALPRGWSLIATGDSPTPTLFDAAIATAQSTPPAAGKVYSNLTSLWAWSSTAQTWYFWAPSLINSGGLAGYLTPNAYLDFATLPTTPAGTLSPTTGVWVNMP